MAFIACVLGFVYRTIIADFQFFNVRHQNLNSNNLVNVHVNGYHFNNIFMQSKWGKALKPCIKQFWRLILLKQNIYFDYLTFNLCSLLQNYLTGSSATMAFKPNTPCCIFSPTFRVLQTCLNMHIYNFHTINEKKEKRKSKKIQTKLSKNCIFWVCTQKLVDNLGETRKFCFVSDWTPPSLHQIKIYTESMCKILVKLIAYFDK